MFSRVPHFVIRAPSWAAFHRDDDASADSEGTDTLKKPARQSPAYSNVEMEKSLNRREKNR